jgi:hypothetical protein
MTNGTRKGWGVNVTHRPLFTPGEDPVHIVQEAGWAPGPVWIGAENDTPTRIRFPDRPARSQSLYRLRYPANTYVQSYSIMTFVTSHKLQNISSKCPDGFKIISTKSTIIIQATLNTRGTKNGAPNGALSCSVWVLNGATVTIHDSV